MIVNEILEQEVRTMGRSVKPVATHEAAMLGGGDPEYGAFVR